MMEATDVDTNNNAGRAAAAFGNITIFPSLMIVFWRLDLFLSPTMTAAVAHASSSCSRVSPWSIFLVPKEAKGYTESDMF
jgi:hypothetical protein